jgi:rubredoxin
MTKSDVTCPECSAGYRRVELLSKTGTPGIYRCLVCDHPLEVFDGNTSIAYRLTVQPEKIFVE